MLIYMVQVFLAAISAFFRRGAWMFGWPARFLGFADLSEDDRHTVARQFLEDHRLYDYLLGLGHVAGDISKLQHRRVLQLTPNINFKVALDETPTASVGTNPELIAFTKFRSEQLIHTQVVGDVNGSQTKGVNMPCRKFRRPAVCMARAIEDNIIDERHGSAPSLR